MGTRITSYEYRDKATGTDETGMIYRLGASIKSQSPLVGPKGEKPIKKLLPTDQMPAVQKS